MCMAAVLSLLAVVFTVCASAASKRTCGTTLGGFCQSLGFEVSLVYQSPLTALPGEAYQMFYQTELMPDLVEMVDGEER